MHRAARLLEYYILYSSTWNSNIQYSIVFQHLAFQQSRSKGIPAVVQRAPTRLIGRAHPRTMHARESMVKK